MPRIDHNGEDFHYIVSYRRMDQAQATEIRVDDWRQKEIIIPDQGIFKEYEIFVQAANQKGRSPDSELKRKTAFSGEDSTLRSSFVK